MSKFVILLEMLMLLGGRRAYSRAELCDRFDLTERTFYRYIHIIRDAGFLVHHENTRYYIELNPPPFRQLHDLLHFSREEASLFYQAIHSIPRENQLKRNLLDKLYKIYDIEEIAKVILQSEAARNTQALIGAIKDGKQVLLTNYRSANSGKISDRHVEPFDFTTNYVALWAFELATGRNKLFKTARIGTVKILPSAWQHKQLHKTEPVDHFRMSSPEFIPVQLEMTLQAANLMQEDFPLSQEGIRQVADNQYVYTGSVANFKGIGRFILSLPRDVKVIEPQALKDYLNRQQKKF